MAAAPCLFMAVMKEQRLITPAPPTGAIVGGILGVLVFIAIVSSVVFFVRKRQDDAEGTSASDPDLKFMARDRLEVSLPKCPPLPVPSPRPPPPLPVSPPFLPLPVPSRPVPRG
ncbi:unnamed protein product [Pleuronectes platessa]|uniref:Uncharacterized protein n=1 Tax=Pleuronectes platessa TaxID=8262 RepID=A0A9N7YYG9_PLEPL|nr:unnamed protein product [Pleuronectes platessa]